LKTKIMLAFMVFAILSSASCAMRRKSSTTLPQNQVIPGTTFTRGNVEELRETFKKFADCLYVKLDGRCVWALVAKDSPFLLKENPFSVVFEGELDTATLEIDASYIEEKLNEEGVQCLNPTLEDGFCITHGVADISSGWYADEFVNPPSPDELLITTYEIRGKGYWNGLIFEFWVRENNQWKLYTLGGSD